MSSPNSKVGAWAASKSLESKKIGSHSPSWRGLAGTVPVLETRTRRPNKLYFPVDDDEDVEYSSPLLGKRKIDETSMAADDDSSTPKSLRGILELAPLKAIIERNSSCRESV